MNSSRRSEIREVTNPVKAQPVSALSAQITPWESWGYSQAQGRNDDGSQSLFIALL